MAIQAKVRGVYSTALTKILLDCGYTIVQPSSHIQELFNLEHRGDRYDILLEDRKDLQGIKLSGDAEEMTRLIKTFQEKLYDAVLIRCDCDEEQDNMMNAHMELPGKSKQTLDEIRSQVTPTLARHHRFRVIDSRALEKAEEHFGRSPEQKEALEGRLFTEGILGPLQKAHRVRVEHAKPFCKPVRPREGVLFENDFERFVMKRSFSHGRYDGLDLPIEEGDYCLTEVREGQWYVKHAYYSCQGELKGEYYNINTPVELYPFGARYVDLEIDVVRRAGENPFVIDRERLALLGKRGIIGISLQTKAEEVAESIEKILRAEAIPVLERSGSA